MIIGSDILLNLGKEMLPNFGVIVFVIHFVRGVTWIPQTRSSNPSVKVVALCSCEEKYCSICASIVLISSDIMFCIISSTFIVPGDMRPSGGSGKLGVKRCVEVECLLEFDPCAGCCCYARLSFAIGVFPDVDRGCIEATGLCVVFCTH